MEFKNPSILGRGECNNSLKNATGDRYNVPRILVGECKEFDEGWGEFGEDCNELGGGM